MITVRIPKDIRAYKEKLVAGLTMRMLLCVIVGGALGGLLFWLNKTTFHWSADSFGFAIMFIAIPIGLIGFFQPEGMPFEKYMAMTFKFGFTKKKIFFQSVNVCKPYQERTLKSKEAEKRSLERAVIFMESLENGENITLEEADKRLVTVPTPDPNKDPKRNNKQKKTKLEVKEEKLKKAYDAVKKKQAEIPNYCIKKNEIKAIKDYNYFMENKRKQEVRKKSQPLKRKSNSRQKKYKAKTTLPKSVQDAIPYIQEYDDGIFEIEKGVFSKLFTIDDMNYFTAEESKQVDIFAMYAEFLNSFDESITITIYIDNRVISQGEQERKIFYPMTNTPNDLYRSIYNKIMAAAMKRGRNNMVQTKYLSATIKAVTLSEAEKRFKKIDIMVENGIKKLGTNAKVVQNKERLEILHDKFRQGREGEFSMKLDNLFWQGISTKDYIAPTFIEHKPKYVSIDDTVFYRTVFLNNLPSQLLDTFFRELVDNNFPLTTAINIVPIPQSETLKMVSRQKTGMELDIINAQKKASKSGYSAEIAVPQKTRQAYNDADELYDDVTNKSQKMFFVTVMMMFSANDLETLDQYEEELYTKARKVTAQMQTLVMRQLDGLRCCLPMGVPCIDLGINRALTSESTAVFIPFACQELFHKGGYYYGLNAVSRNLILIDRTKLPTPSGFILGTSGSGKSFAAKREMINVILHDDVTPILIIDPENEYSEFVKGFGGEAINISATSDFHINPMEMSEDYGLDVDDVNVPLKKKKEKALKKKSEYLIGVIECMLTVGGGVKLSPQQRSFIDMCIGKVYKKYLDNDFNQIYIPTLQDLQFIFDDNAENYGDNAKLVASGTRLYTTGSMDLFSHKSNVNLSNRLISFNIRDLGDQLKQLALLIVLDFIWNKMCEGSATGRRTYCYADEIHVLFKNQSSAEFLQQLYKRGRKYGLVITGITQDIDDLLATSYGRGMVGNSDFLILLKQSEKAMEQLSAILNISDAQSEELRNAPVGSGIIKATKTIVPFIDNFPKDNELYPLMSTNFNEKLSVTKNLNKQEIKKV